MSVLVTALFTAVILVITGVPETPLGWARPVLLGVVVLLLSFRLLGAGVTTSRHFQRGLGEGSAPRPDDLEAKGRAAGAVVGRALKAARAPATPFVTAAAVVPEHEPAEPEPVEAEQEPVTTAPEREATIEPEPVEPEPVEPEPEPVAEAPDAKATEPEPEPAPAPAAVTVEPGPEPDRESAPETPAEKPKVTADAAARSIGSMVGRRMAERRKKS
jgi:outer membrane biosynthesis protein TonB